MTDNGGFLSFGSKNDPESATALMWRWECKCGRRGRWQYNQRSAWILGTDHYYDAKHHHEDGTRSVTGGPTRWVRDR